MRLEAPERKKVWYSLTQLTHLPRQDLLICSGEENPGEVDRQKEGWLEQPDTAHLAGKGGWELASSLVNL